MRILHVDTGRTMRGGQYQVLELLRLQREAGHEILLLARGVLLEAALVNEIAAEPVRARALFRHSRSFDVVHVHDARAHTLAAVASQKPFVVSRRVGFPVRAGVFSRWKYARAARYLAVSRYVSQQLQSAGVPADRIDVVYDAVSIRQEGRWDPDAPAAAIDSDDPGKCRAMIDAAARRAGVTVLFSSDLPRAFTRASMFVYLSEMEGLGSAAALAMRMGIPVVASQAGGLAEVFEDAVSGYYTANETDAIAAAMRRVVDEPARTIRMIEAAKERACRLYSPERMLNETNASYRRALAG